MNQVSFGVSGGEKLGIFGRTGSGNFVVNDPSLFDDLGKSSITNALFRLYPIESGKISIDQADITTQIGLQKLRRSMAIIPQESGLFAGSLRSNLDPLNEYSDDQLWASLEKSGLKNLVILLFVVVYLLCLGVKHR